MKNPVKGEKHTAAKAKILIYCEGAMFYKN